MYMKQYSKCMSLIVKNVLQYTGTSKKIEYGEKVHLFLVTYVKMSYILDSLHVKKKLRFFLF